MTDNAVSTAVKSTVMTSIPDPTVVNEHRVVNDLSSQPIPPAVFRNRSYNKRATPLEESLDEEEETEADGDEEEEEGFETEEDETSNQQPTDMYDYELEDELDDNNNEGGTEEDEIDRFLSRDMDEDMLASDMTEPFMVNQGENQWIDELNDEDPQNDSKLNDISDRMAAEWTSTDEWNEEQEENQSDVKDAVPKDEADEISPQQNNNNNNNNLHQNDDTPNQDTTVNIKQQKTSIEIEEEAAIRSLHEEIADALNRALLKGNRPWLEMQENTPAKVIHEHDNANMLTGSKTQGTKTYHGLIFWIVLVAVCFGVWRFKVRPSHLPPPPPKPAQKILLSFIVPFANLTGSFLFVLLDALEARDKRVDIQRHVSIFISCNDIR
ncbi:uncharacterized protein BYT42DRAFT_54669 [Radiomyces spectabilis]|uniref:uncharacterized protein n=1 Tax=Radiomyces spectabilis TaxID=64574 RepID=UPI00222100C6|nr:uncharacterized protein BYT42DRAFT_54669 [Radiomyces spectabilis]KAI8372996.1 hypothetical protein BYT42DRAFT_54669 [Radiomyces spectabilis]